MPNRWKKWGVITNIIQFIWIVFITLGTEAMVPTLYALSLDATIMIGITSVICLIFLAVQGLWALSASRSDKRADNLLAFLHGGILLICGGIVMATPITMGPYPTYWVISYFIFIITFLIDLIVGQETGNLVLILKDVEETQIRNNN